MAYEKLNFEIKESEFQKKKKKTCNTHCINTKSGVSCSLNR